MKELLLLAGGFGDASQANLTTIGGGKNDVGAVQSRKQLESFRGRGLGD
jgi:hypothetical protein